MWPVAAAADDMLAKLFPRMCSWLQNCWQSWVRYEVKTTWWTSIWGQRVGCNREGRTNRNDKIDSSWFTPIRVGRSCWSNHATIDITCQIPSISAVVTVFNFTIYSWYASRCINGHWSTSVVDWGIDRYKCPKWWVISVVISSWCPHTGLTISRRGWFSYSYSIHSVVVQAELRGSYHRFVVYTLHSHLSALYQTKCADSSSQPCPQQL